MGTGLDSLSVSELLKTIGTKSERQTLVKIAEAYTSLGKEIVTKDEKQRSINMDNKNVYDLFEYNGEEDSNQGTMIPTESLVDFYDHIFSPYTEEMMQELMNSVEDVGLLNPLLVRKHSTDAGKYEILSGHNRAEACRRLGMTNVHARIFSDELSDEEARLIVIETNLKQRNINDFKISERARIVSARHKLMKKQGYRTDLLNEIEKMNTKTKDSGGEPFSLGRAQIYRYIRINDFLIDGLKDSLDEGKLNMFAGVELSFLEEEEQEIVDATITAGAKISSGKATAIKKKSEGVKITKEILDAMLANKKKEEEKKISVKLSDELIEKYFKEIEESEIKEILELALEEYFKS